MGDGGGGDLSFADASAIQVTFETSQVTKDGVVFLIWPAEAALEADGDRVPDAADRCRGSNLNPTVLVDGRDTGAPNHLDADGCTLGDRIAKLASGAAGHRRFVRDVAHLTRDLRQQNLLTRDERRAILQAAGKADIPPGRGDGVDWRSSNRECVDWVRP